MKDLPHHLKKLNRRVIRDLERLEREEDLDLPEIPNWKPTERQIKKQAKERKKQERLARAPNVESVDESNRKMKKRVPIFGPMDHHKPPAKAPRQSNPNKTNRSN